MNETQTQISIVVLCYNSADTINGCLKSIFNQSIPGSTYEVIVIDNGSTDQSLDIVDTYDCRVECFPQFTIAQLRNKGVEIANSDLVGFVDSDCEISYDWIKKGLRHFSNPKVAVAGFKYRLPLTSNWIEEGWLGEPDNKVTFDSLIPAGNMIVVKRCFMSIGGIAPDLISDEDTYILKEARKAGFKTISDPDLVNFHHGNPKTIMDFFKKEVWYGAGVSSPLEGIRSKDKPFLMSILVFGLLCVFVYGTFDLNYTLLAGSILTYLMICFCSAVDRRFIKKVSGRFATMFFLYTIYFAARTFSLVYVTKLKSYQKT